jgi:hypothetical protein
MATKKMTMGKGAVVSVLSSRLHPSLLIRDRWPNPEKNLRVENLVIIRQEVKKVNRRDAMTLVMTHEDFKVDGEYTELHAIKRFCIIKSEGDPYFSFTFALAEEHLAAAEPEFAPQEIQDMVARGTLEPDDIYLALEMDDDNGHAPENLPQEGQGNPLGILCVDSSGGAWRANQTTQANDARRK